MRRAHAWLVGSALALSVVGCGDDDSNGTIDARLFDAAPAADAAAPDAQTAGIETVPLSETRALAGLGADVDVVRDNRGVVHIYGKNDADVLRVQG